MPFFSSDDEKYIIRRLAQNDVVLFLGAGFARDALNRLGLQMPLSRDVCEALWGFLEYEGSWEGTPLPDMYEALLRSGRPFSQIRPFLEERLLTSEIPGRYDSITSPFWYRIYTTNVDDVLPRVYGRVTDAPRLWVQGYPKDEVAERDQALDSVQAVFLHGLLPCKPDEVTFSVRQYARRASQISPMYQAFLGDYATRPTIFVGTELNEPLFWQHLESREQRVAGVSEQRPKSFLVAPKISPPKLAQLAPLNVVHVRGEAADFLDWLQSVEHPTREDVLRETMPSVVALFEAVGAKGRIGGSLGDFGAAFHLVPTAPPPGVGTSFYLFGATPRWEDILRDLDAPRHATQALFDRVEEVISGGEGLKLLALTGSAGSGKSTALRRLGLRLSRAGRLVFLTNSEELPPAGTIRAALAELPDRAVLLFDNGEVALNPLASMVEELKTLHPAPVIVIASRSNEFLRKGARLQREIEIEETELGHLKRDEVVGILQVLEANGVLGHLQGLSHAERIEEFESRDKAGKQLLVAMREATSGLGFNDIIRDEFESVGGPDVKLLYLFVALATDVGFRLTRAQVVKASALSPGETLHQLERSLREIVIPTGAQKDLLLLRHRVIAGYVLQVAASRALLADAYKALLPVLAAEMKGRRHGSTVARLFRDLLNHRRIYERFESSLEDARAIFESVEYPLRTEAHFWLQYGLLELEYGNLEFAENYLRQAESLNPKSDFIQNSIGHLYLKQGVQAVSETAAFEYRREATAILEIQMDRDDSPYPFHIYCSQRLAWAHRWLEGEPLTSELEHLRQVVKSAREAYPRNRLLRRLSDDIEREYLGLALR